MDSAYLAAVERGAHAITLPTAKRIADALRVSLVDPETGEKPVTAGLGRMARPGLEPGTDRADASACVPRVPAVPAE